MQFANQELTKAILEIVHQIHRMYVLEVKTTFSLDLRVTKVITHSSCAPLSNNLKYIMSIYHEPGTI